MKIEKCFTVAAPRERVWQFITSPEDIAACLPGCEGVEVAGEGKYKTTVKVQAGPIKTSFKVDVEATEERAPEFAAYVTRGEEGGRASRVSANSTLTLKPVDGDRTEVSYVSDIAIVGRLGKFGAGIMKKKADAMGEEFAQAFRLELEGSAAPQETAVAKRTWRSRIASAITKLWQRVRHRDVKESDPIS